MALDLFKLLYKEFPNKENTVKGTENRLHNFTQDANKLWQISTQLKQ